MRWGIWGAIARLDSNPERAERSAKLKANPNDPTYSLWPIFGNRDADLLRVREKEFVVHFSLCLFVRTWLGLWFSTGRMAIRTG